MSRVRWFISRLRGFFDRRTRERDLSAELQFHLDEEADERAADGVAALDAQRAAKRSMGNLVLTREATRETWVWPAFEQVIQDVRYAVRVLRRRPAFTVTALLSLALGIGANTALFGIANNLFIKSLPVERPHELVRLRDGSESVTYPTYDRLRRGMKTLQAAVMMTRLFERADIDVAGEKRQAFVQLVSDNYFDALGVRPVVGLVFRDRPPADARDLVAVISHRYWSTQYGGQTSVIGSRMRYGTSDLTVIGVGPPGFHGLNIDTPADIWVPFESVIAPDNFGRSRGRWLQVLGRLRSEQTPAPAGAEATAIMGRPVSFVPGAAGFSTLRERLRRPFLLLEIVAGLVLLITCANLANLGLAGAAARERELTIRRAIGASRGRILSQLLTETAVLSFVGAVLAPFIASWASASLLAFLPPAQEAALTNLRFAPDLRILAFVILLTCLTIFVAGLAPAIRAAYRGTPVPLRVSRGGGRHSRDWASRGLVIVGVTMCTLLLIVAGVFVRTLHNLRSQDAGYVEDHLIVADVELPETYPEDRRVPSFEMLRERVATLPGVTIAGFSYIGQLSGIGLEFNVRGLEPVAGPDQPKFGSFEQFVSPHFLPAMGTTLVAGRHFTDRDDGQALAVAIVNEAFVRRLFPGSEALGRRFVREDPVRRTTQEVTVVGIVRDSKWTNLRDRSPIMHYVPIRQRSQLSEVRLVMRNDGDLEALRARLPDVARAVDPAIRVTNIVSFREIVNRTLVTERLVAQVSTAFAAFGLLIACIGLYGVLAYAVVRRRREIGVRIAVGASPGAVEWLMLRDSLVLVAIGFLIGMPLAIVVVRLSSSMLFGLEPEDPATMVLTLAILMLTTFVASYLPARRAAGIDPLGALRDDG